MKSFIALVCLLPFVSGYLDYHPPYDQCKVVNGGWGEWSRFGPCSKSCGRVFEGGIKKRHRYCDAPIPKYGGMDCKGYAIETKFCKHEIECPVDGGWGPWTKSQCSKTCGRGELIYKRHCNIPIAHYCGKPCNGPSKRIEYCNVHKCPTPTYKPTKPPTYESTKPPTYAPTKPSTNAPTEQPTNRPTEPTHNNRGNPCLECYLKAEKHSYTHSKPDFVGHACRVDKSHCDNLYGGINKQYPGKLWFFLTCSADGPWCKPCATRTLIYNPKCGQCETTRYGKCTGPVDNKHKYDDDEDYLDMIDDDVELYNDDIDDPDEELWRK